ncbi:hypothetical protein ABZ178_10625 [Streptomyces massasporeus]
MGEGERLRADEVVDVLVAVVGLPVPAYITDERQDEYHRTRAAEQHL